jgi:dihydrofolate synthase/folylpolyglutamate synthase
MVELFFEQREGRADTRHFPGQAAGAAKNKREEVPLLIQAVREGLARTRWPGRCQIIEGDPLILLDGAQNAASAQALRDAVEELFPHRRVLLVLGASIEKDLAGIASVFGPWATEILITQANSPRAESPEALARVFQAVHPDVRITPSVADALDQAKIVADPNDLIVVTGSLFVVGETLQAVRSTPTAALSR